MKVQVKIFKALILSKIPFPIWPVHGIQWRHKFHTKPGGNWAQLFNNW